MAFLRRSPQVHRAGFIPRERQGSVKSSVFSAHCALFIDHWSLFIVHSPPTAVPATADVPAPKTKAGRRVSGVAPASAGASRSSNIRSAH